MMKYIQDNHYLVWTDALHARELSRQANNRWDRGTYVRWAIMSSWIALEMACQDALEDDKISYSFKKNVDQAIQRKNLPVIQWANGLWQEVTQLQEFRKNCTHRFLKQSEIFPGEGEASKAVSIVRNAVKDIYKRSGKTVPKWIDDDYDQGWARKGIDMFSTGYEVKPGMVLGSPHNLRFAYTYKDHEYTWAEYPPDTEPDDLFKQMIASLVHPISRATVYKGTDVLKFIDYDLDTIRGT
jgi:hypothetical protein